MAQLSAQSLAYNRAFLFDCTGLDLGNLVRCALEAQTPPDTTDDASKPVLLVAAYNNSNAALKALLAGGANIELADKKGCTALGWAAQEGHLPCVQLLLDAGANANAQDCPGNTPLMQAVMIKHVECVRALLPATDLSITNIAGKRAFHVTITTASEECFELLLPLMSDVDVRTVPGVYLDGKEVTDIDITALHFACQTGQASTCKALLGRGADRMARDSRQSTPLHYAAVNGHLSCIVLLVGRPGKVHMTPAEVDAADGNGCTALHFAAAFGFTQVCAVLMGAGASLDAKTSDGGTPLTVVQCYHPTNAALLALLSCDVPALSLDWVCDQCGKTAEQASVKSLKSCRDCSAARYCGKECQLAAWPGHKAACKARVAEREERARPIVSSIEPEGLRSDE